MKRYVILGSEDAILTELNANPEDTLKFTMPVSGLVSLKQIKRQATRHLERKVILRVVEASGWNRRRAAERLDISYRALLYKLKEVGRPPAVQRPVPIAPDQIWAVENERPSIPATQGSVATCIGAESKSRS